MNNKQVTVKRISLDSPRCEFNLSLIIGFHKRYHIGDRHDIRADHYDGWDSMQKALVRKYNVVVIHPLYMYDHGGVSLSTTPFNCPWDSGQVGFVVVTRESMMESGHKRATKKVKEWLSEIIHSEIEEYNAYLNGEMWEVTYECGETECVYGDIHKWLGDNGLTADDID